MAEARFIKTVAFGGYDKAGVIRRMEYLNTQVHDLRNELRETKLLLEAYKKGTSEEKAHESVMTGERNKLTQVQVQNDILNTKLKASEEENRNYEQEVKELKKSIAELEDKLKAADTKVAALQSHNEAMALSSVFIEAQKSASMLEGTAKSKAAETEAQAKKVAENIIEDANIEAEQVIYEAERTAAETIAEAQNKSEQMDAASNNLRAVALNEVYMMKEQISSLQTILEQFRDQGLDRITSAAQLLSKTENTLKEGGVPVFREPKQYAPQIPEAPMSLSEKHRDDAISEEEKLKKQQELEKLKKMAESIGAKKPEASEKSDAQEEKPQNEKKSANSLADIAAKAKGLSNDKNEKKGGKVDLAAIAAKANALGKK